MTNQSINRVGGGVRDGQSTVPLAPANRARNTPRHCKDARVYGLTTDAYMTTPFLSLPPLRPCPSRYIVFRGLACNTKITFPKSATT